MILNIFYGKLFSLLETVVLVQYEWNELIPYSVHIAHFGHMADWALSWNERNILEVWIITTTTVCVYYFIKSTAKCWYNIILGNDKLFLLYWNFSINIKITVYKDHCFWLYGDSSHIPSDAGKQEGSYMPQSRMCATRSVVVL
jgi:hypothetical protein